MPSVSPAFQHHPTILLPNKHFEAEIWTGTGSQRAITGYDFAPDWVWVKRRSNSGYHILANTLSGANNYMVTNTNSSESVEFVLTWPPIPLWLEQ